MATDSLNRALLQRRPGFAPARGHLGRRFTHTCLPTEADAPPSRWKTIARPLTSFVGRAQCIDDVTALLDRHSLVTLTGSAGCGKSRLATEVALRILPGFADGGGLVDLATIDSPAMVPSAVAAGAGIPERGAAPLSELLAKALSDRHFVLVVDNCERLADACSELLYALLRRCPQVVVLATSRSPLGVDGEVTWRVPSLSLSETSRLFVDRAQLAQPGFALTAADEHAASTICRRLEGIPLAIELAAGRLRMFSVAEIAEGLDERFGLLCGGPRTAPPHQRTLEASVAWSYDLLSDIERRLFLRLSVFAAGFTMDAAEAVCADGDLPAIEVRPVLADLVDRSMVQVEANPAGARYRMLESIREFARVRLAENGQDTALRDRLLDHVRATAATDRIELLVDDIRSAVEWSLRSGRITDALHLAADVHRFWIGSGREQEGQALLADVLASEWQPEDGRARTRALLAAGDVCAYGEDVEGQTRLATEALDLARELGDCHLEARALVLAGRAKVHAEPSAARALLRAARQIATDVGVLDLLEIASYALGEAAVAVGDLVGARQDLHAGIDLGRSNGSVDVPYGVGWLGYVDVLQGRLSSATTALEQESSTWLAVALMHRGRYAEARALFEGVIATGRMAASALLHLGLMEQAVGNASTATALMEEAWPALEWCGSWFQVQALIGLGDAAAANGDTTRAVTFWRDAMGRAEASRNPLARSVAKLAMARAAVRDGDVECARSLRRNALRLAVDAGYRVGAIDALEALAVMAADEDRDASPLLAAVDAERDRTGYVRFPVDEVAFASARQRVAAAHISAPMTFDEAVTLALGVGKRPARPLCGWASLTPAEEPVVALVAEGLSNREIGERLYISPRTVQAHLSHVFAKLGIDSRARLAAAVSRRDCDLVARAR